MTCDLIIAPCQACGTEGRIYHQYAGSPDSDWSEPCTCCEGTGGEMIEGEPLTLDDLEEIANADTPKSVPSVIPTPARGASPQESLPESNNQSETP